MAKKRKIWNGYDKKGKCKLCQEMRTDEGHDPCIANLPGVNFACCGHGLEAGYIAFTDGRCLRFHPTEVDLNLPDHFLVRQKDALPVFVRGDENRRFKFKTGETKTEKFDYVPVADEGWTLIPPIEEK